ncbi:ABC transporter ATP-binding protein [Paenibacillus rigui]
MSNPTVEMKQIVKRFGSVLANDHVDFSARSGEIHALLGENGAGKSTVMSILSGLYRADSGEIRIRGQLERLGSPKTSMALGIGVVYQQFRLVPTMSALENLILAEKTRLWQGRAWMKAKREQIEAIAATYGLEVVLERQVWQMSVGEQQRLEILKTLYRGADIVLLDEPTSVLTPAEAEQLYATLKRMKEQGATIVVSTHKLKEVMASADRISVMRKGKMIRTMAITDTNVHELAGLMVDKEMSTPMRAARQEAGEPILTVERMSARGDHGQLALHQVNFKICAGEIVGIAGVAGNGQKELAEVLTGLRPQQGGSIDYLGQSLQEASIRKRIDLGIAHVPEHRLKTALAGSLGSVENLLLKSYRTTERSRWGAMRTRSNKQWTEEMIAQFQVSTPGPLAPVQQLSGGNQQKLVFAREISQNPRLMIAVHPTQGLDIGASQSVHHMLMELKDKGSGVLLISEDLDELIELSDRILVIYGGQIVGEFAADEVDVERIGLLMAGISSAERGIR